MGISITDKDRLRTLNVLFNQEGLTDAQQLPFSRKKLDYLRPLKIRLTQVSNNGTPEATSSHSAIMLRQMIDELLLEITAQVNWSIGAKRSAKSKKALGDFGLIIWNQMANPILSTTANVA